MLSDVCEMQMDAKSQLAYAEELLKLAAKARDREMEMLGNLAKGNALGHLGQHGLAVSHQRLASKIAKEIGDQSTAGRTYGEFCSSCNLWCRIVQVLPPPCVEGRNSDKVHFSYSGLHVQGKVYGWITL